MCPVRRIKPNITFLDKTSHCAFLCNSFSGVTTHFFMSWVIFLLPTIIKRLEQKILSILMAMENYSKRVKDPKRATAL